MVASDGRLIRIGNRWLGDTRQLPGNVVAKTCSQTGLIQHVRALAESVEEETTLDKIPVPARAALEKAADTGKIALVEIVTEGGKTSYEAQIKNGRKTSEIAVDATGRKVN